MKGKGTSQKAKASLAANLGAYQRIPSISKGFSGLTHADTM